MVMLHPFNGLNPWGDGSNGAGPAAGTLTNSSYNYTSWTITGNITLNPSATGTIIRVMGNFSIAGSGNIQALPDPVGSTDWGSATDGTWGAGGTGGSNTGVTINRVTTIENQFWSTWTQAGCGSTGGGTNGFGSIRFTLLVGGSVTFDTTTSDKIIMNGFGSSDTSSGGGGGGIVCIISGTKIIKSAGANLPVQARGYNGRTGGAGAYGGGGGGGGAIVLMAPLITDMSLTAQRVLYGAGGPSTFGGAGNSAGGGGSFGAGGNGGSVAHPAGYDGSYGQTYSLLISPLPIFQ